MAFHVIENGEILDYNDVLDNYYYIAQGTRFPFSQSSSGKLEYTNNADLGSSTTTWKTLHTSNIYFDTLTCMATASAQFKTILYDSGVLTSTWGALYVTAHDSIYHNIEIYIYHISKTNSADGVEYWPDIAGTLAAGLVGHEFHVHATSAAITVYEKATSVADLDYIGYPHQNATQYGISFTKFEINTISQSIAANIFQTGNKHFSVHASNAGTVGSIGLGAAGHQGGDWRDFDRFTINSFGEPGSRIIIIGNDSLSTTSV